MFPLDLFIISSKGNPKIDNIKQATDHNPVYGGSLYMESSLGTRIMDNNFEYTEN